MKVRNYNLLGITILLLTAIAWGSSFVILKETINDVPPLYVLAIRFGSSAILLAIIFYNRIIKINLKTVLYGVFLGAILCFAYALQTYGLEKTTPARNAFFTGTYCVLTPFLAWFLIKKRPKLYNLIAAFLAIIGIGLIVLGNSGDSKSNTFMGDALTLSASIFYAFQIIFIDKFQDEGCDSISLLVFELLTVGIVCGIGTIIFDLPKGIEVFYLNNGQILRIFYLTIVCTLLCQLGLMIGQKLTTSAQSSLILSLEAVFGVIFSVIFGNEIITLGIIIGFVLIMISMLINELKIDPLKLLNKNLNEK